MIPFATITLDKVYKLRFGMGAMVEFEQATNIKIMSIQKELSIDTCARLLWIMLKQEDATLTFEKTCQLVDEYAENITDVIQAVSKAMQVAFEKSGNIPNAGKPKK